MRIHRSGEIISPHQLLLFPASFSAYSSTHSPSFFPPCWIFEGSLLVSSPLSSIPLSLFPFSLSSLTASCSSTSFHCFCSHILAKHPLTTADASLLWWVSLATQNGNWDLMKCSHEILAGKEFSFVFVMHTETLLMWGDEYKSMAFSWVSKTIYLGLMWLPLADFF